MSSNVAPPDDPDGTPSAALTLGWREGSLPIGSHVCCYYANEAALREMLGFLRVGLDEEGTLCVIFADTSRFDRLLGWLQETCDTPMEPLVASGKLALIGGEPDLTALVRSIVTRLDAAMSDGYTAIRFLGFIGWGQPGWPDDRVLLEFESRVNEVVQSYPAVILCTYGVPFLSGSRLIRGGLQTHPTTLIGDRVVTNSPFYVPVSEFVASLDEVPGEPA